MLTACPENDSRLYEHIPTKNISNRSELRIATSSAWILGYKTHQPDKLWLISTSNKNRVILFKIPKIIKLKPVAYMLYPFSLVADIVTSPYQLFLYLYLKNVMSVG